MIEKGIEEIFKSGLHNFEADVDPNVWTNVQQSINAPTTAQANHGAHGSMAGKAGAVAGKLGVKAIIGIIVAAAGVSVGAYFLLSDSSPKSTAIVSPQHQTEQVLPQQQTPAEIKPNADITTTAAVKEKTPVTEKQNIAEHNEPAPPTTFDPVPSVLPPPSSSKTSAGNNNPPPVTSPAPTVPQLPKNPSATDDAKPAPAEQHAAPENPTFQNGFDNLNNYIDNEASETKGLPNAFSPNGDGKNDAFKINTKNLKSIVVTIYDRSGKQIYQWNHLDGEWNGNLPDGRPAPVGVYYYSVQAETMEGKICIGNSTLTLNH